MARKKKEAAPEDRVRVAVSYRLIPYFAVETNLPALTGIKGVGRTPFEAIVNVRGEVRRRYGKETYDLDETIENPEFAAGWRMPEPF